MFHTKDWCTYRALRWRKNCRDIPAHHQANQFGLIEIQTLRFPPDRDWSPRSQRSVWDSPLPFG